MSSLTRPLKTLSLRCTRPSDVSANSHMLNPYVHTAANPASPNRTTPARPGDIPSWLSMLKGREGFFHARPVGEMRLVQGDTVCARVRVHVLPPQHASCKGPMNSIIRCSFLRGPQVGYVLATPSISTSNAYTAYAPSGCVRDQATALRVPRGTSRRNTGQNMCRFMHSFSAIVRYAPSTALAPCTARMTLAPPTRGRGKF